MGGLITKALHYVDRVSEVPTLKVNGRRRFASIEGGLITVMIVVAVLGFTFLQVHDFVNKKVVLVTQLTRYEKDFVPFDYSQSGFLPILDFELERTFPMNDSLKDVEDLFYFEQIIGLMTPQEQLIFINGPMIDCNLVDPAAFKRLYRIDKAGAFPTDHSSTHLTMCINATKAEADIQKEREELKIQAASVLTMITSHIRIYPCDSSLNPRCGKFTENRRSEILSIIKIHVNQTQPMVDFSNGAHPIIFPSRFAYSKPLTISPLSSTKLHRVIKVAEIEDVRTFPLGQNITHKYWHPESNYQVDREDFPIPLICSQHERSNKEICPPIAELSLFAMEDYEVSVAKRRLLNVSTILSSIGGLFSISMLMGTLLYKLLFRVCLRKNNKTFLRVVFALKPPSTRCCKKRQKDPLVAKAEREREAREKRDYRCALTIYDDFFDVHKLAKELCLLKLLCYFVASKQTRALAPHTILELKLKEASSPQSSNPRSGISNYPSDPFLQEHTLADTLVNRVNCRPILSTLDGQCTNLRNRV